MTEKLRSLSWLLRLIISVVISGAYVNVWDRTFAQIIPDSTLPTNSTFKLDGNTVIIQGGTKAGSNLYHSFEQFSVLPNSQAYFNNALDIQNIISRVTGSSVSVIDGPIKANGSANLFLINPNGIIFGSQAELDIKGSLIATTANSLKFADGTLFSAFPSQSTPLLTVSVPIGLQFQGTAGGIRVEGSNLQVEPSKTLALVGGDVTLQGGKLEAFKQTNLTAGVRIELGSVAGVGEVSLNQKDNNWVLGYASVNNFGDIRLQDKAFVDVPDIGGDVQIQSRNLVVTGGSLIYAAKIDVNAADSVQLSDASGLFTITEGAGPDIGGDVQIQSRNLVVTGGSLIYAAKIDVNAADSVQLSDASGLFTITEGAGNAGNLTINTKLLSVRDGAQVSTATIGNGQGGNLTINTRQLIVGNSGQISTRSFNQAKPGDIKVIAADSVLLSDASGLFTETAEGTGNAGNLTIDTNRLSVRGGSQISTSTINSEGKGGNLFVIARDLVELQGTGISPTSGKPVPSLLTTQTTGVGDAGDLKIITRELILGNGSQISTTSLGQGNAGDIEVHASDIVNIFGVSIDKTASGLFSRTYQGGQGGNIIIDTNAFRIADNGIVDARTFGKGNAGNITFTVKTLEAVNGGQILANSSKGSSGFAGSITVNATDGVTISGSAASKRLIRELDGKLIEDESVNSGLFVRSQGSNIIGNINVNSPKITLDNQAQLNAESASGNGGNINVNSNLLLLRHGAQISTNAGTNNLGGNGGNININSRFIVAVPNENSDISANAYTGTGGKVQINSQGIFGIESRTEPTDESDITASSKFGVSGVININAPDTSSIQNSFTRFSPNVIDTNALIANSCISRAIKGQENSFTITGSGALRNSPGDVLISAYTTGDVRSVEPTSRPWKKGDPIIEAQGVYRLPNGQLILSRSC